MLSTRWPSTATLLFLAAVSAWFVANRYVDLGFYRLGAGQGVEVGLNLLILGNLLLVTGASVVRSWQSKSLEWPTIVVGLILLLLFDVAWRLLIAPLPLNAFKLAALVMDLATPLVAVLGIVAAIGEWRMSTPVSSAR